MHVFLQTEGCFPARGIQPVTHDNVAEVIAACRADFLVLIADQNLASQSVQLRVASAAEFVNVPLVELSRTVLHAWSGLLTSTHDSLQRLCLVSNPNVVTRDVLHALFQRVCLQTTSLKAACERLEALANVANSWPCTNGEKVDNVQQQQQQQQRQHRGHSSDSSPISQSSFNTNPVAHTNGLISSTRTSSSSSPSQQQQQQQHELNNDTVHLPNGDIQHEQADDTYTYQPPSALLLDKALRCGLYDIANSQHPKEPRKKKKSKPASSGQCVASDLAFSESKSDISFCWLQRSDDAAAKLLRSQLETRRLHRKLVSAVTTLSQLPVSTPSIASRDVPSLPTEAHRQRLLREVNDLVPRVEEIGERFTRRPKTRRRRRVFHDANPWTAYIESRHSSWQNGVEKINNKNGVWRCYACSSINEARLNVCSNCHTRSHRQGHVITANASFGKRFREAVNNGHNVPSPWIFAPGATPLQPPASSTTNAIHPNRNGAMWNEESSSLASARDSNTYRASTTNTAFTETSKPSAQHYDLSGPFQNLSFDEDRKQYDSNLGASRKEHRQHHAGLIRQSPLQGFPTAVDQQPSGAQMTSAAQGGPTLLGYSTPQRPGNGLGGQTSPDDVHSHSFLQGSPHAGSPLEHQFVHGGASPVLSGSFQSSSPFLSSLTFGAGQLDSVALREQLRHIQEPSSSLRNGHIEQSSSHAKPPFNSVMEELAFGSYEAVDNGQGLPNGTRRASSNAGTAPASKVSADAFMKPVTSLEALAAASDAANGGTGSATKESLMAVSAVVTPRKIRANTSSRKEEMPPNGVYNMF